VRKLCTMRQALGDPALLAAALPGESWSSWRTMLIALVGEALMEGEREAYRTLTGRDVEPWATTLPLEPNNAPVSSPRALVDTFLCVAGRRSGKSRAMAVAAIYLSCLCDWSEELALGERGLALFLAPSERQARTVQRYASALIDHVPLLAGLVTHRTADTLSLSTGVDLEIMAASWRRARGGTAVCVVLDECAFLQSSDDSSNRDEDVYVAVKPSLATTGGPMLLTSSPSQMEGIVYRLHKRHFGTAGDSRIIVVQAASRELNPKLSQAVIDRAFEDDPIAAEAEYMGQFRTSASAYLPRAVIEKAVDVGVTGRVVLPGVQYQAFIDVAGGTGSDSFTIAIGHANRDDGRDICVVDALLEIRPPFDPDIATARAAELLRQWGLTHIVGDAYAGAWPVTALARHGIVFTHAAKNKSEIYMHSLPLWTSGRVRTLDNPRAVDQLAGLRRKAGSTGRDVVDHMRGSHDDLANVIAGLLWRLSPLVAKAPVFCVPPDCRKVTSGASPGSDYGAGAASVDAPPFWAPNASSPAAVPVSSRRPPDHYLQSTSLPGSRAGGWWGPI
jgi:hypothetical protein